MFLIGFLGLAAVGGAAYALSDVFITDESDSDDVDDVDDDAPEDGFSNGQFLEIDENVDEPTADDTGHVISECNGNLVMVGQDEADTLSGQDGNDQINGYGGDDTIDGAAGDDILHGGDGGTH